jgi:bacillithiol system protein YtxJ
LIPLNFRISVSNLSKPRTESTFYAVLKEMSMPWSKSIGNLPEVDSVEECDLLMQQDLVILFKHSPTCPVSWMAHREVMRLRTEQPDLPLYLVSVRRRRDVARFIAERTGIRHESPQVIVLRGGAAIASVSHDDVTASAIQEFVHGSNGSERNSTVPVSEKTA